MADGRVAQAPEPGMEIAGSNWLRALCRQPARGHASTEAGYNFMGSLRRGVAYAHVGSLMGGVCLLGTSVVVTVFT